MDLLLATTLRALMNRQVWMKFQHVLSEEVFPNTTAATIYILLEGLHKTSKKSVSAQALRVALEAHVRAPNRRAELGMAIDYMMEVKRSALRSAEQAIRRYLARGYAEQALYHYNLHCNDAAFDYAIPAALMERAHGIIQVSDEPTVAARRMGLPGDVDLERCVVGLGYSAELDRALLGGIGRGELGVLLAPPARGKTSYLIAAASNAVKQGHHVLYFTLEISKVKVFTRYYQTLTSLTYPEMLQARNLVDACRNNVKGELYVADYARSRLTPSLVHAEIEMQQTMGNAIDYVVIDYAELMDPTSGFGRAGVNSRSLGDMVKELRRVAAYFNIPLLTAWQVNRGGTDKYVFSESDVSECWEVVKHADILLGLNQGPMELLHNTLRLKVLKQRESPARPLVYLYSDMIRNIVRQLDNTEVANVEHSASAHDSAVVRGSGPGAEVYRPGLDGGRQASSGGDVELQRLDGADPAPGLPDVPVVSGPDPIVGQPLRDQEAGRGDRDADPAHQ